MTQTQTLRPLRYTFLNEETDLAIAVAETVEKETGSACDVREETEAPFAGLQIRTNAASAKVYEVVNRLKAAYKNGPPPPLTKKRIE